MAERSEVDGGAVPFEPEWPPGGASKDALRRKANPLLAQYTPIPSASLRDFPL